MVDACFAEPPLAAIYDHLDHDRSDLDAYLAIVEELSARTVLDIGCGTGTFACLLATRGVSVTGLDPAAASLAVARAKPGAEHVRWLHGDASVLPEIQVDLVTMTGNVAQVFLAEDDWAGVLAAAHRALRPGGALVFETRRPAAQGWTAWTRKRTERRVDIPGVGVVHTWTELVEVALPLLSFRVTYIFESDGAVLTSESTLRFRDCEEVEASLAAAGFQVCDVRDAPDRPGLEMVFIAREDPGPAEEEAPVVSFASARSDVHRLGGVVTRKAGPWTRSVYALLRPLEAAGFEGSPRVVGDGFDASGRELLTYIEGGFVHPHSWSDQAIAVLGRMLRCLHDASSPFVPPPDAVWQPWFTRSDAPDAVYGHGDLGPWNIVAVDGLRLASSTGSSPARSIAWTRWPRWRGSTPSSTTTTSPPATGSLRRPTGPDSYASSPTHTVWAPTSGPAWSPA